MRIVILAFTLAACLQTATAGTIMEYNRATFQTALAGATLSGQNFDSLTAGTTITTVNGVTYTPSLGTALVTDMYLTTTAPNGLGSTSVGYFEPDETLTITFPSPITAFALDINTYATTADSYQAQVNDGSSSVIPSIYDVFPNTETGQFIGFTDSTSFSSVVISALTETSYTADTLVYGNAAAVVAAAGGSTVPEPSTVALLGVGMSVAALLARRRKARQ